MQFSQVFAFVAATASMLIQTVTPVASVSACAFSLSCYELHFGICVSTSCKGGDWQCSWRCASEYHGLCGCGKASTAGASCGWSDDSTQGFNSNNCWNSLGQFQNEGFNCWGCDNGSNQFYCSKESLKAYVSC
ncbi:hypothetical protein HDU97_009205 [Phlyctochytrium planicorne]|nr:hypothetical protein HDU97_009205 [Phlyctochytrium planicorne]